MVTPWGAVSCIIDRHHQRHSCIYSLSLLEGIAVRPGRVAGWNKRSGSTKTGTEHIQGLDAHPDSPFAGESLLHQSFFLLFQAIGFLSAGSEHRGDLLFLIACWWNRCACSTLLLLCAEQSGRGLGCGVNCTGVDLWALTLGLPVPGEGAIGRIADQSGFSQWDIYINSFCIASTVWMNCQFCRLIFLPSSSKNRVMARMYMWAFFDQIKSGYQWQALLLMPCLWMN